MDEAQHFSNLCTNKKEYGVVEHLDACDVRRGGEGEREGRGGREKGRVEEDKWVWSVRVRRGVGKGRGEVEWKERGGKGRVEDERLRRGRGRKGREGLCGDGGVGGSILSSRNICLTKYEQQM